jgi:hypothetical protein
MISDELKRQTEFFINRGKQARLEKEQKKAAAEKAQREALERQWEEEQARQQLPQQLDEYIKILNDLLYFSLMSKWHDEDKEIDHIT